MLPALLPILAISLVTGIFAAPQLLFRRWLFWGGRLFTRPADFARVFAPELGLEARVEEPRWGDLRRMVRGLERVRFEGLLDGRDARVRFCPRKQLRNQPPLEAILTVAATDAPPIRITRSHPLIQLAKAIGFGNGHLTTGDAGFDDRFVVQAGDAKRARATLERDVRALVQASFERHGVQELVFEHGAVTARVTLSAFGAPLSRGGGKAGGIAAPTRELLELLARIARAFERVALDVHVLGGTRRALLGLEGHPRCAFCHDGVDGTEPDLVACDRCATLCHAGCWEEHGGCPVLGCAGTSPERASGADRAPDPERPPERA